MKKKYNISVKLEDLNRRRGKSKNRRRQPRDADNVNLNDVLIRRFLKKCKKERIIKEYTEKTSYYKSKSQKKREKRDRSIRRLAREAAKQSK